MLPSTLYKHTVKTLTTTGGRKLLAVKASVRRTSETGTSGWLSPQAIDAQGAGRAGRLKRDPQADGTLKDRQPTSAGNFRQDLKDQVQNCLAGWLTPSANEDAAGNWGTKMQKMLGSQVKLTSWTTPSASDGERGGTMTVNMTGSSLTQLETLVKVEHPARLTVFGEMLTGSDAGMDGGGQLNPDHPRWLMGLPPEWDDCAAMATQSMPKRQKRLSKVISKVLDSSTTPQYNNHTITKETSMTDQQVPIDTLVKIYVKIRDAKSAKKKSYDAEAADLDEKLAMVATELKARAQAEGVDGFKTGFGTVYLSETMKTSCADWFAFGEFLKTHDPLEFMERRVSSTAVKEFMKQNEGQLPPGVSIFKEIEARVRRAGEK